MKNTENDRDLRAMSEQSELTDRLARLLSSSSSTEEICEGAAGELKRFMSVDWAAIALIDKAGESAHLSPLSRRISSAWEPGTSISLTGSPVAWVGEEKKALVEPDLGQASRFWTGVSFLRQGVKCTAYMPLFSRGKVFGGLLLGSHHTNAYGARELRLLKFAASQLALFLENESVRREMEETTERLTAIENLTKLISCDQDVQKAVGMFAEQLKKTVPLDYLSIAFVEGQQARVLATNTPLKGEIAEQRMYRLDDAPLGWVATHKKTSLNPDFSKEMQYAVDELFLKAGLRSGICLPLFSGDEVIGALQLCSTQPAVYGEKEQHFLEELSSTIAMPVRNIYLAALVRESDVFEQAIIHQLATHLTPIIASSDILAKEFGEEAQTDQARLIQNILKSAKDLNSTLSRLLELARIRTTAAEEQIGIIDLKKLLQDVARQALPIIEGRRQALLLELPPLLPPARANALSLHQMLLSLLSTVSGLAVEKDILTLAGTTSHSDLIVEIRFPAPNFQFEERDSFLHVFERHEPDRQRYPELALQLTTARRFIERQGGKFLIERKSPEMIVISFSLPMATEHSQRKSKMQGYCVKCRAEREMKDAKSTTMKNGKPAIRGVCPVCGTEMFRIIGASSTL